MLREYQQKLIDEIFQAYKDGYNAPCIVLPCGGGKSVIVAEVAKIFTCERKHVLFLVHRKELCQQIWRTFNSWGVNMEYCRIAMVQTTVRRLKTTVPPELIITDENHHSLAETYKNIYNYFSNAKRLGVTATPERLDGSGLKDVNDKLIIGVNAKWLIENNYLAPYDYYASGLKIPKFHTRNGDFIQSEVADFFRKNKKIYGDVIKQYKRLADGKQAVCYLPTVEFSKFVAEEFTRKGILSAHIDGETSKNERDRIIENFRNGKIRILCNVDIISEGFDVPDCECVILLRPTKSLALYIQQSMRCMRYKPNKRAIIIDHVSNIDRFGFPDADREWLLDGHPHKKKDREQPFKTCPKCFACVPLSIKICSHCGYIFEKENTAEKLDINLVKINELENRVRYYISPNECTSVEELREYAKIHGYKPGWVYYQQKARGWLNGEQGRNQNTKCYPCRAVNNWDSTT